MARQRFTLNATPKASAARALDPLEAEAGIFAAPPIAAQEATARGVAHGLGAALAVALLGAGAAGCDCGGGNAPRDSAADAAGPDAAADSGSDAAATTTDSGGGGTTDAAGGAACPSLTVTYDDPCDCGTPPCCPMTTFDFAGGDVAASYAWCGDAVACDPPPVGWEQMNAGGGWDRLVTPGASPNGNWEPTPATWVDPWIYSVPSPPSGTVRAIGLFREDCAAGTAPLCAPACAAPYELPSNPIVVP
jgi:hypothetical protein